MRLSIPRIDPVDVQEFRRVQKELFDIDVTTLEGVRNIRMTWAQHPALMKAIDPYLRHLVGTSTLPPREREIVILRIGWNRQSEYEFSQHTEMAKTAGLTDDDIRRVTLGAGEPGWTAFESALIQAVDELHNDAFIADVTWAALAKQYSTQQLMDLVCLTGLYWTISSLLNTIGVQLEPGKPRFPAP